MTPEQKLDMQYVSAWTSSRLVWSAQRRNALTALLADYDKLAGIVRDLESAHLTPCADMPCYVCGADPGGDGRRVPDKCVDDCPALRAEQWVKENPR